MTNSDEKAARRAAMLRENLRKRKTQARGAAPIGIPPPPTDPVD